MAEPELGAGALAGEFLVEEIWRRGGHSTVYRARELGSGRPAALKVLRAQWTTSSSALRRFAQEAEILAQLDHPHIAQVLGCGDLTDGRPYIAMEWLEGRSLGEELRAHGRRSLGEASAILAQVGAALLAAHRAGILHRDVKPDNVMMVVRDDRPVAKLVDFGVAKLLAGDDAPGVGLTSSTVLGTPGSMAPEQILRRGVDARTDVYSLGLLAYELLTGHPPFRAADRVELEELHLYAPPPHVSDAAPVPRALDAVIGRCLAKSPADRFADVEAVLAAWREYAREGAAPPPWFALRVRVIGNGTAAGFAAVERAMSIARRHVTALGMEPVVAGAQLLLARRVLPAADLDERGRLLGAAAELLVDLLLAAEPAARPEVVAHAGADVLSPGGWPAGIPGAVVATPAAAAGVVLPPGVTLPLASTGI